MKAWILIFEKVMESPKREHAQFRILTILFTLSILWSCAYNSHLIFTIYFTAFLLFFIHEKVWDVKCKLNSPSFWKLFIDLTAEEAQLTRGRGNGGFSPALLWKLKKSGLVLGKKSPDCVESEKLSCFKSI